MHIQIASDLAGNVQKKAGKIIGETCFVASLVQARLSVPIAEDAAGAEGLPLCEVVADPAQFAAEDPG